MKTNGKKPQKPKNRVCSNAQARKKGLEFERKIATSLQLVFPHADAEREKSQANKDGIDVKNTGRWKFQCKNKQRYENPSVIREIQCHRDLGEIPVLVTKGNATPPVAVMYFDDFLDILKKVDQRFNGET